MKLGSIVLTEYGYLGVITEEYKNWDHLVEINNFVTGDPAEWLDVQLIQHTPEQLEEKWFLILHPMGGSSWSCESKLELVQQLELLPPIEVSSSDSYPIILKDQSMKTYYFTTYEYDGWSIETQFCMN